MKMELVGANNKMLEEVNILSGFFIATIAREVCHMTRVKIIDYQIEDCDH